MLLLLCLNTIVITAANRDPSGGVGKFRILVYEHMYTKDTKLL